ncbi:MAG: hypothetical protein HY934_03225 [Candidatus Firestonebacteria bacterium]|nr:hypothetical protein [Candidatus Firestonebacteria bacterium]
MKNNIYVFIILIIILFPLGINSADIIRAEIISIDLEKAMIFIDMGSKQKIKNGLIFYFIDTNKKAFSMAVTNCFLNISRTKLINGDLLKIESGEEVFSLGEVASNIAIQSPIAAHEKKAASNIKGEAKFTYEFSEADEEKSIVYIEGVSMEYQKNDNKYIYTVLGSAENTEKNIRGRIDGDYTYYLLPKINLNISGYIEKYDYFAPKEDTNQYGVTGKTKFDISNNSYCKISYIQQMDSYENESNSDLLTKETNIAFSFYPTSIQIDLNYKKRIKKFDDLESDTNKDDEYEIAIDKTIFQKLTLHLNDIYIDRKYNNKPENYNDNTAALDIQLRVKEATYGVELKRDNIEHASPSVYEANNSVSKIKPYAKYNFTNSLTGGIEAGLEIEKNKDEDITDTYYKENLIMYVTLVQNLF